MASGTIGGVVGAVWRCRVMNIQQAMAPDVSTCAVHVKSNGDYSQCRVTDRRRSSFYLCCRSRHGPHSSSHWCSVLLRVAQWSSGQHTCNSSSVTPVRIPGRATATIPLGSNHGQVFFTHTASPVSQLLETGVQKGVFGA